MSPLPLRPPFSRTGALRLGLAAAVLLGGALALGASQPRPPVNVTICATTGPGMAEVRDQYFAARPARGGATGVQAVTASFQVVNFAFNADGSTLTQVDTVRINVGESVQFNWVAGTHTTTSGKPGDLDAGSRWNLPLDLTHQVQVVRFDTSGVYPFFCNFHTFFNMTGVVVVKSLAGVGPGARVGAGFVSSPAPNPSRGEVAVRFAVTQPGRARVTAFDAGGRAIATVFDRDVAPGTYSAAWTGRSGAGERLAPGAYFLRLAAPGVHETRRVVLVR
jgi:plastocyanin